MEDIFPHSHDAPSDDPHSWHHDDMSALLGHHDPHTVADTHLHGMFWNPIDKSGEHGFAPFGLPIKPFLDNVLHLPGNLIDHFFHRPDHDQTATPNAHADALDHTLGTPDQDAAWWHLQRNDDTCAVVSQQFILDSLTHGQMHFTEDQLQWEATVHGWYTPGGGTPLSHVGDLVAYHGFEIEKSFEATLPELAHHLNEHHKVIVGVHAEDIWDAMHGDAPLTDYPGIPGHHANHAVEVIGIDDHDPGHPVVILNDPGTPDGQALHVSADVFMHAWSASHNFMVNTTGERRA